MIHFSAVLHLDIFYEGNKEDTGQPPKSSKTTKVSLKISQESKNHKPHRELKFQFVPDFVRADHSKATIGKMMEIYFLNGNLSYGFR